MQEAKSYSTAAAGFPYGPDMVESDTVRTRIREQADKLGISLAALSKACGRNHAYFQQFIERGTPRNLPEGVREKAAEILKLNEDLLRAEVVNRIKPTKEPRNASIGGTVGLKGTVPVYGHAMGGRDGQFIFNGNQVGDMVPPPSLVGVKDAYAVYVAGNSMENRYFAGEVVFVNPGLPIIKGKFVVAQIAAEEGDPPLAYVKQFVSMDDKRLRLRQFNPDKILEFPRSKVVSVHRIIMGGEG